MNEAKQLTKDTLEKYIDIPTKIQNKMVEL